MCDKSGATQPDPVPAGSRFPRRSTGTVARRRRQRPFKTDVYHPGNWRKRLDFGTGTFGDMGCHIFSTPIRGVNLYLPTAGDLVRTRRRVYGNWPMRRRGSSSSFPGTS